MQGIHRHINLKYFYLILFMQVMLVMCVFSQEKNDDYYKFHLDQGNKDLEAERYVEALKEYGLAKLYISSDDKIRISEIDNKTKETAEIILSLNKRLKDEEKKAIEARDSAVVARIVAQGYLAETRKIISAFYFYEEQFALAYKYNKYGFINKKGDVVIGYKYEFAQPFDNNGLSRVKRENQAYLLDNKKNEYWLASGPDKLPPASEAPDLALDLSNLQLTTFPGNIVNASNLKVLLINGNEIRQLPESVGTMSQLRKLFIYNNKLGGLPVSIGFLSSLITLDASINKLEQLPETIGDLNSLQELVLYDNNLTGLPESLGDLQKLFFLDLSDNLLYSLPKNFKGLDSLRILALGENQFKEFPAGLKDLPGLIMLDLGGNFISTIPNDSIKDFDRMTHLHLWNNQLQSLPDSITGLENLKVLYAGDNHLDSLPHEMDSLDKLQELILYGNRLKEIPAELGRIDSLRKIDLRNNAKLDPGQVFTVFSKTSKQLLINTSDAEPDFLPNERTLLIRLDTFDSLPQQLAEMKNLVMLDLFNSRKITADDITKTFEAYPKAKVYSSTSLPKFADSTRLLINVDILPFLSLDTAQARKIIKLDLSNRGLDVIPDVVFSLENLTSLNLSGNNLKEIPGGIGKLTQLGELDLSDNDLSVLPVEIKDLAKLKTFRLRNTSIEKGEKERIKAAIPGCKVFFDGESN